MEAWSVCKACNDCVECVNMHVCDCIDINDLDNLILSIQLSPQNTRHQVNTDAYCITLG